MCRLSHDTLEGWARFYSIWCLIVGLLVGLSYCFVLIFDTIVDIKTGLYVRILSVVCAILGLSYALAGLLMLLGYRQDRRQMFEAGKVLSYFFAVGSAPAVVFIIVHIFTIPHLIRFARIRWNPRS